MTVLSLYAISTSSLNVRSENFGGISRMSFSTPDDGSDFFTDTIRTHLPLAATSRIFSADLFHGLLLRVGPIDLQRPKSFLAGHRDVANKQTGRITSSSSFAFAIGGATM